MTTTDKLTFAKNSRPLLLMVSAIVILIMGLVGLVFFTTAVIYQYFNPQFLYDTSNIVDQYKYLNLYVIVLAILHFGMITSALLIIKLKKAGYYLFISIFLVLLASELLFEENLIINYLIPGIILTITIGLYFRRLK